MIPLISLSALIVVALEIAMTQLHRRGHETISIALYVLMMILSGVGVASIIKISL